MRIFSSPSQDDQVIVVEGAVGVAEVDRFRAELRAAVTGETEGDVILDVRRVDSFDDAALAALTASRALGKPRRRRIVVVDGADGATCASLRRSGQIFRFPVHPDVAAAGAALRADRLALTGTNPVVQRDVTGTGSDRRRRG